MLSNQINGMQCKYKEIQHAQQVLISPRIWELVLSVIVVDKMFTVEQI